MDRRPAAWNCFASDFCRLPILAFLDLFIRSGINSRFAITFVMEVRELDETMRGFGRAETNCVGLDPLRFAGEGVGRPALTGY